MKYKVRNVLVVGIVFELQARETAINRSLETNGHGTKNVGSYIHYRGHHIHTETK